jgi:hypothetical protein
VTKPACITATVAVCVGKDCRAAKGFDKLLEVVSASQRPRQVPCQDHCDGPVIGLRVNGKVRWFVRVRTKELRRALAKSLKTGELDDRLAASEFKKARGKIRHENQVKLLKR